jgi:hypothetical protein
MAEQRRVKIRFFAVLKKRVHDPAWPSGNIPVDWLHKGAPQRYDRSSNEYVRAGAPGLSSLSYGEKGTAYVRDPSASNNEPDPDYHFAEVLHDKRDVMHLRFWRVRRSQLPSIHDLADGSTEPLPLEETEGIAEAVDIVLFPKACVAGILVNRAGPSRASILSYLEQQTAVAVKLAPLTREDALDIVNGDRVTHVDVEVAAGHFEALASVTDEMGQAAAAVDTPGLRTMRISLSAERDERGRFWQWWQPRLRRIVNNQRDDVKTLDVAQAASGDLAAHVVDLLEQQIGLEVSVPVETGRTVEPEHGRNAVVDAYNTYNDLIRSASDQLDAHAENRRTERKGRSPDGDTVES